MKEPEKMLSPASQELLSHLLEHAKEQDKSIQPHMLIGLDEDGFMVKHPGPSEYVNKWVQELADRKEFYSEEEVLEWLEIERDKEMKHLKIARKADAKTYYRLFLKLIQAEIGEISQEETEEGIVDQVKDHIRKDDLEEAMQTLHAFVDDKDIYEDESMELIMQEARLAEITEMHHNGVLDKDAYFLQKGKIRLALLTLLKKL